MDDYFQINLGWGINRKIIITVPVPFLCPVKILKQLFPRNYPRNDSHKDEGWGDGDGDDSAQLAR